MVRILAHQRTQPGGVQEFLILVAQVHDDFGAAIGLVRRLDLVRALPVRLPAHRRGVASLGEHGDPVGDDERGIEADAELTDELRVLGAVSA